MRRPSNKRRDPDGHADERRRQFEESRGLSGRRSLEPDDEATGEPPEKPELREEGPDRDDKE